MTNYLFDTNHASWLMAQEDSLVARVRQAQADGAAQVIGSPVVPVLDKDPFEKPLMLGEELTKRLCQEGSGLGHAIAETLVV